MQLAVRVGGSAVRRYRDPLSDCRFVIATPGAEPELWRKFLAGATASYHKHGVERALEYDRIRDGSTTSLFFAAVDSDDRVVAGLRVQGPYVDPRQAHAPSEWAGHPGQDQVLGLIASRIPYGSIEIKTAWVSDHAVHRHELAAALARVYVHAMIIFDVRFAFATVASHVLEQWRSTGGTVSAALTPVPYPDDRYLTTMMWWDRTTFAAGTDPLQLSRIIDEQAQLGGVQLSGPGPGPGPGTGRAPRDGRARPGRSWARAVSR